MLSLSKLYLALMLIAGISCVYDISNFGAVPNSDVLSDQFKNQRAILAAVSAANQSDSERCVRIPNKKYYSMPIRI